MKFLIFALSLLVSSQGFAAIKCPAVIEEPKALVCDIKMSYVGQKFNKVIKIDLTQAAYKQWTGSTDFEVAGTQTVDGKPNKIKTTVWTDTHGNSPTCPVQQIFETEIEVVGYKVANAGRKTNLKIDDGFGFITFQLEMNCAAE